MLTHNQKIKVYQRMKKKRFISVSKSVASNALTKVTNTSIIDSLEIIVSSLNTDKFFIE